MAYLGKTPSQAVRSRFYFTASGGETSLSPSNVSGLLFTDANFVDVSLNGVALVSGTDYTATPSTNTISSLAALTASDVVEIIVYDVFSVFGGNFTADLNLKDNVKSVYGDGNDLQIFHDGSHSRIAEDGTGDLKIGTSGGAVRITANGTSQEQIVANQGGAVTLAHSGTTKLATSSSGVTITGDLTFGDGHTIGDDGNDDLTLTSSSGENIKFNSAGGNHLFFNNGTEKARFDASDNFLVGATSTASSDFGIKFLDDGTSKILAIHRQASDGDYIQFARGGTAKGNIKQDSGNIVINATDDFEIETNDGTKRLHVGSNGHVGIGTVAPSQLLHVEGTAGTDTRLLINNPGTGSSDDSILRLGIGGTSAKNFIQFGDADDSNAGQIQYAHGSNSMAFTTGAAERLVLDGNIISTTSTIVRMGQGTGGVSLTTNDGYGNANVTFNHEAGVPEQGSNDSSGRITVDTDNANSRMAFELKSTVTANVGVSLTPVLQLYGTSGTGGYGTMVSEGGTAGRVDLQQGSCKAWVRWEMDGTFSRADDYNITSVTDDGNGQSSVVLNNQMNNTNWAVVLGGTAAGTSGGTLSLDSENFQGNGTSPYRTTTQFHTRTVTGSGSNTDAVDNNAAVFGDQA